MIFLFEFQYDKTNPLSKMDRCYVADNSLDAYRKFAEWVEIRFISANRILRDFVLYKLPRDESGCSDWENPIRIEPTDAMYLRSTDIEQVLSSMEIKKVLKWHENECLKD